MENELTTDITREQEEACPTDHRIDVLGIDIACRVQRNVWGQMEVGLETSCTGPVGLKREEEIKLSKIFLKVQTQLEIIVGRRLLHEDQNMGGSSNKERDYIGTYAPSFLWRLAKQATL